MTRIEYPTGTVPAELFAAALQNAYAKAFHAKDGPRSEDEIRILSVTIEYEVKRPPSQPHPHNDATGYSHEDLPGGEDVAGYTA